MTVRSDPAQALVTLDVARAVEVLRTGGLVGLPTETVYGLGADASSTSAVLRVFAVKGRPADHPLIVHLADPDQLDRWARDVPGYARRLAVRLWPGPLTLVLPRSALVGDHVTGGQPTVGLRCPAHPVAQAVLGGFGGGVAAPSANRFGRVSPTTAGHVLAELGDRLDPARDVVLDGGSSRVGIESTILDCTGPAPRLLRSGAVTAAEVLDAAGVALVGSGGSGSEGGIGDGAEIRAPGMLAAHYAPQARLVLVTADAVPAAIAAPDLAAPAGLIAPATVVTPPGAVRLAAPEDDAEYARGLYTALREADVRGLALVVAVPPGHGPLAAAVCDRLRRAATGSGTPPTGAG